jgi:ketosteroid isomerase-like protein
VKLYQIPLIFALILPCIAFGQKPGQSEMKINAELKDLCKNRIIAFSGRDTKTIERICSDNYRLITQTGMQLDLDRIKKLFADSTDRMSSSTLQSFQTFLDTEGMMAFSISEISEEFISENSTKITNNLLVTDVYSKNDGKWKILLTHISQKICAFPE